MTGGAACPIANITGRGRRRRAVTGAVALVAAAGAAVAFDDRFEARWWRAGLLPVVFFAYLCLFQAQEET